MSLLRKLHLISLSLLLGVHANEVLPLKCLSALASSEKTAFPAQNIIDGVVSDSSSWISSQEGSAWVEIHLQSVRKLGGLHFFCGSAVSDFSVQFWARGQWQEIPSASVSGNMLASIPLPFDDTVDVITDRIRINIHPTPQKPWSIREVVIWPYEMGDLPPIPAQYLLGNKEEGGTPQGLAEVPLIYLNQSGFNLGKPKYFTAPKLANGTRFMVRRAKGGGPLFDGEIQNNKGNFSAFNPDSSDEYVVEAGGETSVPFRIGLWWLERVTYQNTVHFMTDSRHYVGNETMICRGSYGWRDDHHFGWELQTLVPQWISNPSAYERMPRGIHYQAPTPVTPALWGKLQPYSENAPDIVKLIHWGADVIVTQGLTHELLKSQLAYFLYAWPTLEPYLPRQNYEVVRDFAFSNWANLSADRKYPYDSSPENNLLALKVKIGSTKGEYPPGFSVQPNLMMYEVALREHRPDAELYFEASKKQTEWMIAHLDWNDPLVTKGQRISEFITMTGLAHLLSEYPDRAPVGLVEKIDSWAKTAIRRSDNLWDFRKLDDGEKWTPMEADPQKPLELHPHKWNEPGNVVGLPASLLAAQPFIRNPSEKARLNELVWSHFDNMFGRNPTGRHFSYDAPREIEGVEFGWYKFLPGGIGRLVNARFVIDGSPKNEAYPYHPENGPKGWTEGWIQHNTPFNLSLAYMAHAETQITATAGGKELMIRLLAPLNFDYEKIETGRVQVFGPSGDFETVVLTEESKNSKYFKGSIPLQRVDLVTARDGVLQYRTGEEIEINYGYGYLGQRIKINLK